MTWDEIAEQTAQMNIEEGQRRSDGSAYHDEIYGASPHRQQAYNSQSHSQPHRKPSLSREESLRAQASYHQRSESSTSFRDNQHGQGSYSSHSHSRSQSRSHSRSESRDRGSPLPPSDSSHGQSRWTDTSQMPPPPQSATSYRSVQSVATTRSRTHSNNLNNPPISAANPQTAFVKIKIFDRVADDLIAIRVHPKVSHHELMEKVQARLGSDLRVLKYRDSLTNTFVGLDTDAELRAWMDGTDKHVLYAD